MMNVIYKILTFLGLIQQDTNSINYTKNEETIYTRKKLMTDYEYKFYNILKELQDNYTIVPQLNLAAVVKKINNNRYYSELFRNIDFAIFDKDCSNLLMLIEIDDSTHNSYKRRQRDEKVNNICHDVGIKILHFYTSYPNEEGYVLNRILKNLNNNIDNKVSNTEENNTYTLVR